MLWSGGWGAKKRPPPQRAKKTDASTIVKKWSRAAESSKKNKTNGNTKRRREEEEEEIEESAEQQTQTPLASLEDNDDHELPTVQLEDEDTFQDDASSSSSLEKEDTPMVEEPPKKEEVKTVRKKAKKSKGSKVHQVKAINVVLKDVLEYEDITISSSAKTIISHAIVHFGKDILVKASKIDDVKHRKRIGLDDIRAKIICTVPSPDLMMRMQRKITHAVDSYSKSVRNHVNLHGRGRPKPVRGEERAGLHVKVSNVRNLARTSVPNYGGIDKIAYVAVAACMEVMLSEIIHRCVGSLVSAALVSPHTGGSRARPGATEPTIRSASAIRLRIEDHDVDLVLNRTVRVQEIQDMALRHPLFHSRRREVSEEVERALRTAEEITPKSMRPSKRKVIKDTKREVEKWNKEGLLRGEELLFLMSQANALPIIFSNFKVPGARTMPNVRVDMLPEKLQKRCLNDIQSSISGGSLDGSMTLRVLDYLSNQYISTDSGRKWAA